jgi:chromosome segregation ATPase
MLTCPPSLTRRWIETDGPKRLKKLDEAVVKKENDVADAKLAIQELEDIIKGIENDIHLADKNRKNMEDNIRHRQFKTKVEVARAEIESLDVAEARIARDQYERKYAKSKKNEQEMTSQVSWRRRRAEQEWGKARLESELTFPFVFSTLRSWERSRPSRFRRMSLGRLLSPSTRISRRTS